MISMTNMHSIQRALGAVFAALLAALLLSGCDPVSTKQSSTAPSPTQGHLVTVIKVLDGDTVVVADSSAQNSRNDVVVRLLGVDAPEMNKADREKQPECGAVAATEFLTSMLIKNGRGVQVELVLDARVDHQDKYGRTLAYLQLTSDAGSTGSTDVNAAIIRSGHAAAWYPRGEPKPERSDSYEQLETQAIASKAGLHAQCSVVGRS